MYMSYSHAEPGVYQNQFPYGFRQNGIVFRFRRLEEKQLENSTLLELVDMS